MKGPIVLVDEWMKTFWTILNVKPKSRYDYQRLYIRHLQPVIGHRDLSDNLKVDLQRKILEMPKNRSKEVYVLGYTRNTGKPNDILVALNRAINVSKEIKRLNPRTKVGYAGLGVRTSPVCAKQKNICAVVTIR